MTIDSTAVISLRFVPIFMTAHFFLLDSSQYDTRDVGKVKKDLWYCSKFVKQVKGNEEVAYDRMVGV